MSHGISKEQYYYCPFCKFILSKDDYDNMILYFNCPRCHLKRIYNFIPFIVILKDLCSNNESEK